MHCKCYHSFNIPHFNTKITCSAFLRFNYQLTVGCLFESEDGLLLSSTAIELVPVPAVECDRDESFRLGLLGRRPIMTGKNCSRRPHRLCTELITLSISWHCCRHC